MNYDPEEVRAAIRRVKPDPVPPTLIDTCPPCHGRGAVRLTAIWRVICLRCCGRGFVVQVAQC